MIRYRHMAPFALTAALLIATSPAYSHAQLIRASPPADGSVQTAPREVALLFSEKLASKNNSIVVTNASGARVDQNDVRLDSNGKVIRAALKPLAPGIYKVIWRVQSVDTHKSDGSFSFRVAQ
jgi:methionine-rich copper-binding protein CopC